MCASMYVTVCAAVCVQVMETDMHRVIYSRQRLSDEHVKYFMYQLVCGLRSVSHTHTHADILQ